MSKHTPAPWTVDLSGPFTLGGDSVSVEATDAAGRIVHREVCNLFLDTGDGDDSNPDLEEDMANARLIAAAPSLLEACKATLDRLDYLRNLWGDEGITRQIADTIRAAVAAAEGKDAP